jgi:hypothetical protein
MAAGYFTPGVVPDAEELKKAKGRGAVNSNNTTPNARRRGQPATRRRGRPFHRCDTGHAAGAPACAHHRCHPPACRGPAGARAQRRIAVVRVDERHARRRGAEVAEVTRERYPRAHPVPQPLAPLRGRRRQPQGRTRHPAGGPTPARGPTPHRPHLVSVLLDAGAGPDWHYTESATGQPSRAPKAWAWPASTPSPAACSPATRTTRCRSTPAGLRGLVTDHLATPSRSARPIRWSAWRAAPCCCAGWAKPCWSSPKSSATTAARPACSMRWSARTARPRRRRPRSRRTTSCRSC